MITGIHEIKMPSIIIGLHGLDEQKKKKFSAILKTENLNFLEYHDVCGVDDILLDRNVVLFDVRTREVSDLILAQEGFMVYFYHDHHVVSTQRTRKDSFYNILESVLQKVNPRKKQLIVGLQGLAGSGKSTMAAILQKELGFSEYAFAAPLKEACKSLFALSDEQVYGDLKEVDDPIWKVSPRYILQRFGTEMIRQHLFKELPDLHHKSSSLFIDLAQRFIYSKPDQNIVLSDVRFEDEAALVTENEGILVRIVRDSCSRSRLSETHSPEHASARAKLEGPEPDIIIYNNGTMSDFKATILSNIYSHMKSLSVRPVQCLAEIPAELPPSR